jgi:hypothetical protein
LAEATWEQHIKARGAHIIPPQTDGCENTTHTQHPESQRQPNLQLRDVGVNHEAKHVEEKRGVAAQHIERVTGKLDKSLSQEGQPCVAVVNGIAQSHTDTVTHAQILP